MESYIVLNVSAYAKYALDEKGSYDSIGFTAVKWTPSKNTNAGKVLDQLKRTQNIDGYDKV